MCSINPNRNILQSLITWLGSLVVIICIYTSPESAKSSDTESSGNNTAQPAFNPTLTPTADWLPKPGENPAAQAKDPSAMKPYTEKIPGTDVKFDMVPIPGGTFNMGSPENQSGRNSDEGPQHKVKIEPFWMGKCEVTWQEYELWGLGLDISAAS